jgi:hypothetical protein
VGCVVENVELRKVFGPKTGGVTGYWKVSDSELLHYVGSSPNIKLGGKFRRMSWAVLMASNFFLLYVTLFVTEK